MSDSDESELHISLDNEDEKKKLDLDEVSSSSDLNNDLKNSDDIFEDKSLLSESEAEEQEGQTEDFEDSDSSSGSGNTERCAICLGRINGKVGSPDAVDCEHFFCLLCILEWAKTNASCPQDRRPFESVLVRQHVGGKVTKKIPIEKKKPEETVINIDENPTYCEVCGSSEREDCLLLCDGCDLGYHLECLTPPLTEVPIEEWFCPLCVAVDLPQAVNHSSNASTSSHAASIRLLEPPRKRKSSTTNHCNRIRMIPRTRANERVLQRISITRRVGGKKKRSKRYKMKKNSSKYLPKGDDGDDEEENKMSRKEKKSQAVQAFIKARPFGNWGDDDIDAAFNKDEYAEKLLQSSSTAAPKTISEAAVTLKNSFYSSLTTYMGRCVHPKINSSTESTSIDVLSNILENQSVLLSRSKDISLTEERKLMKKDGILNVDIDIIQENSVMAEPLPSQKKAKVEEEQSRQAEEMLRQSKIESSSVQEPESNIGGGNHDHPHGSNRHHHRHSREDSYHRSSSCRSKSRERIRSHHDIYQMKHRNSRRERYRSRSRERRTRYRSRSRERSRTIAERSKSREKGGKPYSGSRHYSRSPVRSSSKKDKPKDIKSKSFWGHSYHSEASKLIPSSSDECKTKQQPHSLHTMNISFINPEKIDFKSENKLSKFTPSSSDARSQNSFDNQNQNETLSSPSTNLLGKMSSPSTNLPGKMSSPLTNLPGKVPSSLTISPKKVPYPLKNLPLKVSPPLPNSLLRVSSPLTNPPLKMSPLTNLPLKSTPVNVTDVSNSEEFYCKETVPKLSGIKSVENYEAGINKCNIMKDSSNNKNTDKQRKIADLFGDDTSDNGSPLITANDHDNASKDINKCIEKFAANAKTSFHGHGFCTTSYGKENLNDYGENLTYKQYIPKDMYADLPYSKEDELSEVQFFTVKKTPELHHLSDPGNSVEKLPRTSDPSNNYFCDSDEEESIEDITKLSKSSRELVLKSLFGEKSSVEEEKSVDVAQQSVCKLSKDSVSISHKNQDRTAKGETYTINASVKEIKPINKKEKVAIELKKETKLYPKAKQNEEIGLNVKEKSKYNKKPSEDVKNSKGGIYKDLFGDSDIENISNDEDQNGTPFTDSEEIRNVKSKKVSGIKHDTKVSISNESKLKVTVDPRRVLGKEVGPTKNSIKKEDFSMPSTSATGLIHAEKKVPTCEEVKDANAIAAAATASKMKVNKALLEAKVVEEAKRFLNPYYLEKRFSKDIFKEIISKCVNKVLGVECSLTIEPKKIQKLVDGYVELYQHKYKKSSSTTQKGT